MACASLEELRLDYEDFLRQRRLPLWPRDDPRRAGIGEPAADSADDVALWVKIHGRNGLDGRDGQSMSSIPSRSSTYAEIAANATLVLIGVAVSLLDCQLAAQAAAFEREGGFTERLYRTRQARRRGV